MREEDDRQAATATSRPEAAISSRLARTASTSRPGGDLTDRGRHRRSGHRDADGTGAPMLAALEVDGQVGTEAVAHVGHEEVDAIQPAQGAWRGNALLRVFPGIVGEIHHFRPFLFGPRCPPECPSQAMRRPHPRRCHRRRGRAVTHPAGTARYGLRPCVRLDPAHERGRWCPRSRSSSSKGSPRQPRRSLVANRTRSGLPRRQRWARPTTPSRRTSNAPETPAAPLSRAADRPGMSPGPAARHPLFP